ncbi:MAG: hypothetical protein ACQSGP_26230 [Frankia sp.]
MDRGGTAGAAEATFEPAPAPRVRTHAVLEPAPIVSDGPRPARRIRRTAPSRRPDLAVLAAIATAVVVAEALLHNYLTRPFWYDEVWRAHYVSVPVAHFWSRLAAANTPSAAAWMAVTRLAGQVFGWHAWALRLPETATLPFVAGAVYLLLRLFVGRLVAAAGALAVGLNGTILDLGTQLKPYGVEAIVTVAIVTLWITGPQPGPGASTRTLLVRRTLAGLVSLFGVPLAFVVLPLAAADTATSPRGARLRTAAVALPAVVLAAVHTVLFVGHQSGQRHAGYWDRQFLAGRGLAGGSAFVWRQLVAIAGGAPAGIDRYDGNLVHAFTDHTALSPWVIAPMTALAWIAGARVLARRRDGRIVLGTLVGAELAQLGASGLRYWPFGAVRVNLFLVPLIVLVTAAGTASLFRVAGRWIRRAHAGRSGVGVRLAGGLAAVAGLALAGTVVLSSLSGGVTLWHQRNRLRGVDLLVDAATATRRLARTGDLVLVAGRLARPGWIYAMEASDDGPSPRWEYSGWDAPAGARPARSSPRVPLADMVFISVPGDGETTAALHARRSPVNHVLVFVFDLNRRSAGDEFTELRANGWCAQSPTWAFPRTGTLTRFGRCAPTSTGDSTRSS